MKSSMWSKFPESRPFIILSFIIFALYIADSFSHYLPINFWIGVIIYEWACLIIVLFLYIKKFPAEKGKVFGRALMALAILVLIGAGIIFYLYNAKSINIELIPPIEGKMKLLDGDKFEFYFPMKTKEGYLFVGNNGLSFINPAVPPSLKKAYIDYDDGDYSSEFDNGKDKKVFTYVSDRQAYYGKLLNNQKPIYVYSLFIGEFKPEDYQDYIALISRNFDSESNLALYQSSYKNRHYYIYLKKDMSAEGLKGKESIGSAVISFPEVNVAATLYFYETRISQGDKEMMTKKDMDSVCRQLIDYVLENKKK